MAGKSTKRARSLEAEGFFHGTQSLSPEMVQRALQARTGVTKDQRRLDATDYLKKLEAVDAITTREQSEAQEAWLRFGNETAGLAPEFALPLLATILAGVAVFGEAILLAPVMDGFGIANRTMQLFTASILVLVASGLIHLTVRQMMGKGVRAVGGTDNDAGAAVSFPTLLLAALSIALISILGWWRGEGMIFAGQFSNAQWGAFLSANETLTKVCVTTLTIALPVFAGISFDWGYQSFRYAFEWRKARALHRHLCRKLETVRKQHEAQVEKLELQAKILDQENQESTQGYLEHYALGQAVGAQRPGLELITLKIAAVTLLIVGGCYLVNPLAARFLPSGRLILYTCITLGLAGLYAYRLLKGRDRPTSTQLYQQRGVNWREKPNQKRQDATTETAAPESAPFSGEHEVTSVSPQTDRTLKPVVRVS